MKKLELPISNTSYLLFNCGFLMLFLAVFNPTAYEFLIFFLVDSAALLVMQFIDRKTFMWLFPDAFIYLQEAEFPRVKEISPEQRIGLFYSMVKAPARRALHAMFICVVKAIPGAFVMIFIWKHEISNAQQLLLVALVAFVTWTYFYAAIFIEQHERITARLAEFHRKYDLSDVFRQVNPALHRRDTNFYEVAAIVSIWLFMLLIQWQVISRGYASEPKRTAIIILIVNIAGLTLLTRIWYIGHRFFAGGLRNLFVQLENFDPEVSQAILPLHSASELAHFEKVFNSLNDKLRAYKQELSRWIFFQTEESRYRALGELSALIVHDLSAPLHVIHFCTQQLKAHPELLDNPRYVDQLALNGTRALELISSLKAYLKGGNLENVGVTYGEVHQQVIRLLETQFEVNWFQSVQFLIHDAVLPLQLKIPKADLIHVLLNLFRNSLDNLFQNAIATPRIEIKLVGGADASTVLSIQDNGTGLSVERFEALTAFQYFPGQEPPQRNGLGLRLVRRLVERTGGTLKAIAPPPGSTGALFHLSLLVFGFSSELSEDKLVPTSNPSETR